MQNGNLSSSPLRQIPRAIWALGFVSLLMDTSSEIIYALLSVYLVAVLGASMLDVGVIEGIAEATASITCGMSTIGHKRNSAVRNEKNGRRKRGALRHCQSCSGRYIATKAFASEWSRVVD